MRILVLLGFLLCVFFIAFISMFFIVDLHVHLLNQQKINVYVFIYASIAMSIFMSFFF